MKNKSDELQSFQDFTLDPYFDTIIKFQNKIIDNNKPNYTKIQAISYGIVNHPLLTDITTLDKDILSEQNVVDRICPNYRIYNDKNLPYASNSMDYLIVANTLEYANSNDNIFKEIWRVLKPNGRLVVMFVNIDNTNEFIDLFHHINEHIVNLDFDLSHKYNLYSLFGSNFILNLSYITQTSEFLDTLFNPLCLMFANVYTKKDILHMKKLENKKVFSMTKTLNM